jgi:hypothetical protein
MDLRRCARLADELEYNYGILGKQLFGRIMRGVFTDLEKFNFP